MSKSSKAQRRHDNERMMSRRLRYVTNGREHGRMRKTPKPCSCHMCCNVRVHEGPTLQERAASLVINEELDELAVSCTPVHTIEQELMSIHCGPVTFELCSVGRHAHCADYLMIARVIQFERVTEEGYTLGYDYDSETELWSVEFRHAFDNEKNEFCMSKEEIDAIETGLVMFMLAAPNRSYRYGTTTFNKAAPDVYECTPMLHAMLEEYDKRAYDDWYDA